MQVIPAIDLKDGRCVRLFKGEMKRATVYSDSPWLMAKQWEEQGAQLLHVVDLNGAFKGRVENFGPIERIAQEVSVPIEVGGGIRDRETIRRYFDAGAARVVISTWALEDWKSFEEAARDFPQRLLLGLDSRDGLVVARGWEHGSGFSEDAVAGKCGGLPLAAIIYTDVERDGTLEGMRTDRLRKFLKVSPLPVIASGGVASLSDIKELVGIAAREKPGSLTGVITGRALYDGRIDFREACAVAGPAAR